MRCTILRSFSYDKIGVRRKNEIEYSKGSTIILKSRHKRVRKNTIRVSARESTKKIMLIVLLRSVRVAINKF